MYPLNRLLHFNLLLHKCFSFFHCALFLVCVCVPLFFTGGLEILYSAFTVAAEHLIGNEYK